MHAMMVKREKCNTTYETSSTLMMQKKASAENETLITIYLNIGPPGCPKKLNFGEVNHKLHPLGPGSSTRRLRVIDCKWPV